MPDTPQIRGDVHTALAHDSAAKHVSGQAVYGDDTVLPADALVGHIVLADCAHARLRRLELGAVRAAAGVHAVICAADVPGELDIAPVTDGDPLFADREIVYAGQALFAVAADTIDHARAAAQLAEIEYDRLQPVLDAETAFAREEFVTPPHTMAQGDAAAALAAAPRRTAGTLRIGGQDHFYLEGQIAAAIPGEDGDVHVHSSTQHPSEVQKLVAEVLDRPSNAVTVTTRRMGGGFGGKETQAAGVAATAALLADLTGRAVRVRLDRDDDMLLTGKRHDFVVRYEVGFDDAGVISAARLDYLARCGCSADLSQAIVDRALFHADNAYFLENAAITGYPCRTNTVSNTAFRGFGGPQGMLGIEHVIEEIATVLGCDALDVRRANLYAPGRDRAPYGQRIHDNVLADLLDRLEVSSDYRARRDAIDTFNGDNEVLRRGIALTPVKFGISFTTGHLNQAGALVHVYNDGSIHLNHGGTEMGQGLNTKVAQVVAHEFQVDIDRIKITATHTGKVPNTSATAASSGSDINGKAAQAAARTIRDRLAEFAARHFEVDAAAVVFAGDKVQAGDTVLGFEELVHLAYFKRVSLSATGFYRTPKIWYDRARATGEPFYYYAYGVAAAEAVIDTLTGESRIVRADLLHDVGRSLNPAIDIGQVEGGFIQGLGWLTSEELWWDGDGRLMTHAPSTYKIPTANDVPPDFRVELYADGRNVEDVIHRSKAVGEPPLMLAIAGFMAIRDAVASLAGRRLAPRLDAPATPERILLAVDDLRARADRREAAE